MESRSDGELTDAERCMSAPDDLANVLFSKLRKTRDEKCRPEPTIEPQTVRNRDD